MLHKETVTNDLIEITQKLSSLPELNCFRLVGGTAAALQIGHRISVDIDFFSNKKVNKRSIIEALNKLFPGLQAFTSLDSIRTNIKGVRVELYDNWSTPFLDDAQTIEGMRMATLNDIAAFKLEAITERREKKDYIDLYYIFEMLGDVNVLKNFKNYNPLVSMKSILFALGEVNEAYANKSVMPEMILPLKSEAVKQSMLNAAKNYLSIINNKTHN
jgi:hypothetical protein